MGTHRAQILRTDYNESLAATIELSLASATFRNLGPEARELLGVVAFFPQGVDEKNLDWLFPTISDREKIFDKFCVLSLAYRSNGFITTLAPLRDYLSPRDPKSSPLLCSTKDHYFARLSVFVYPTKPGFREARWIVSEDANVERLLDFFASVDTNSAEVWNACIRFMEHLYWHKPRETVLRSKIEDLSEDHCSKPGCLFELSKLFESVGNHAERKTLLTHALTLARERRDDNLVALVLETLSNANQLLGLPREGTQQAEEASGIYQRLGDTVGQAWCSNRLARSLLADNQFDSAEDAAFRTIDLIPEKGNEYLVCASHRILGDIYRSKREREKSVQNFKTALKLASRFEWQDELFEIHYSMASLFLNEDNLDDAQSHVEQAKSHAAEDRYSLGYAMKLQARIWYQQCRLEETKIEVLGALEIFEKLGAAKDARDCRDLLRNTEEATGNEFAAFHRYVYGNKTTSLINPLLLAHNKPLNIPVVEPQDTDHRSLWIPHSWLQRPSAVSLKDIICFTS
jgi:tetratricopeptide (TPR) repeat protein